MYNYTKYSKTLFEICTDANCINKINQELKIIANLYNKSSAFRMLLITKRLNNKDKVDIVSKTLNNFDQVIIEFLSIIISNNQSNKILDIIVKFNYLVKTHVDLKDVEITTANSLNEDSMNSLIENLKLHLKTKQKIKIKIDPKIIGGIKLRIGNRILDNSVSYQIKQLKKTLHNM
jgi:F-type H+-transporting ATPase subunit delta